MKKIVFLSCWMLVFIGYSGIANATLVGDTVTIQHYFPDLSSPFLDMVTVVVENGVNDTIASPVKNDFTNTPYYYVNVDGFSIIIDFVDDDTEFWTAAEFNGLVVGSLNNSNKKALSAVSVNTNMAEWDLSRLTFNDTSVNFNWQSLFFDSNTYFNASLIFKGPKIRPVPEPATMLLLGIGLAGLGGVSRKKFKR